MFRQFILNCCLKMAALSRSFKDRLEQLDCPYIEGVEEAWLNELLFKPGDFRIRLLQWLFCRFNGSLEELLDSRHASLNVKMDSRVQRLVYVSSSLGLCKHDDVDLIRGVAPVNRQVLFFNQLLDFVCILDNADEPHSKVLNSTAEMLPISHRTPLQEQFQHDCWYADTIAAKEKIDQMLCKTAKLLPPDINQMLETSRREKGYGQSDKYLLPDFERLAEAAEKLGRDMKKQEQMLGELKEEVKDTGDRSPSSQEKATKKLHLALSELSQLIIGFTYCFENEMQPWCNKSPPKLVPLGPAFKRINNLLKQFVSLLESIATVRGSHGRLNNIKEKVLKMIDKDQTASDFSQVGTTTLESFQECIDVLEESMVRHDKTQDISPNTTLNSTLLKADWHTSAK